MTQILADLDDINANLPSDGDSAIAIADDTNTALLQISVARVIRAYLSRVIDNSVLLSWSDPTSTPETVREIAGKLIASQLYFNKTANTSTIIDDNTFAQKLYDEAIAMMTQIIVGDIILDGVALVGSESLTDLDYWPNSSTDRAFTMGQQF